MNRQWIATLAMAACCLSSNVYAQGLEHESPVGGMIEPDPEPIPPDAEDRAEELQSRGKCAQAIPIFRRLAEKGPGYEISQFNLGTCLFEVSKADANRQNAESLSHEAAGWVTKAANAGFPSAQTSLVSVYLDGVGVASDPIEAAKWLFIYRENGARLSLGLPDVSSDLLERLNQTLSNKTWKEAQSRAEIWARTSQASIEK